MPANFLTQVTDQFVGNGGLPSSQQSINLHSGVSGFFNGVKGFLDQLLTGLPENPQVDPNNPLNLLISGLEDYIQSDPVGFAKRDEVNKIVEQLKDAIAKGDYRTIQVLLGMLPSNLQISPEIEKYIDNMIAQQNTGEAREWEEEQASTNLIKAGNQLEQLGLSSSGVLQTGGSNVNGVGAAQNALTNLSQQRSINRYNQKMAIARQILSMTSSMASAGVYGHAIGAAKKAAGVVTSSAAHSAYSALKSDPYLHYQNLKNDQMWEQLKAQGIVK